MANQRFGGVGGDIIKKDGVRNLTPFKALREALGGEYCRFLTDSLCGSVASWPKLMPSYVDLLYYY
jgi:hypothetical protein